jgi:hypothetical protein
MKIELSRKLIAELVEIQGTEKILYDHDISLTDILDSIVYDANSNLREKGWTWSRHQNGNPLRIPKIRKIKVTDDAGTHDESDGQLLHRMCAYLQLLDDFIQQSDLDDDLKAIFSEGYASAEADVRARANCWDDIYKKQQDEKEKEKMEDMRLRVERQKNAERAAEQAKINSSNNPHDFI